MICAQCCKGFDGIGMICQVCAQESGLTDAQPEEYVEETYTDYDDVDEAFPCNRFYRFTASLFDTFLVTGIGVLIFLVLHPQKSVFFILSLPTYNIFVMVFSIFYAVVLEYGAGATFGKAMHGLSVRRSGGGRITFLQALFRYIAQYAFLLPVIPMIILFAVGRPDVARTFSVLSGVIFVVSNAMYLFTDQHQALHDLMSGCVIKQAREVSPFWSLLALIVFCGSVFGVVHFSYDEMKAEFERRERSSISRYR